MLLTHIAIHLSISVAFMSLPTVSIYIIYIIYVYIYTKHTTRTHKYYIVYIAVLLTGKMSPSIAAVIESFHGDVS